MKAIILNSGVGERLRPLTDDKPKALMKIGDKTLLDYQMDSLLGCGIKDMIITTGHFAFFCAPLYKFSKADFLYWLGEIETFVKRGDTKSYAEDAFNNVSHKLILQPVYFSGELCMEIDTKEDLEIARNLVKSRSTALA